MDLATGLLNKVRDSLSPTNRSTPINSQGPSNPQMVRLHQNDGGRPNHISNNPTLGSNRPPTRLTSNAESTSSARLTRSSIDELNDPNTITERINQLKPLILQLESISDTPTFVNDAPELIDTITKKNNKLMDYTVLNGLEAVFRPTLVEFQNKIKNLQKKLDNAQENRNITPRHINGSDDHMLENQALSPDFTSDFARVVRRESLLVEPLPNTLQFPQTLPDDDIYIEDSAFHGYDKISSDAAINLLNNRLTELESSFATTSGTLSSSMSTLREETSSQRKLLSSMQRQLNSCIDDYNNHDSIIKSNHQSLKSQIESTPTASQMTTLKNQVERFRDEQSTTLNAKLLSFEKMIDDKFLQLRQELTSTVEGNPGTLPLEPRDTHKQLQDKVENNSFRTERLSKVTRELHQEVKELRSSILNTSSATPSHNTSSTHSTDHTSHIDKHRFLKKTLDIALGKIKEHIEVEYTIRNDIHEIKRANSTDKPKVIKLIDQAQKMITDLSKAEALDDLVYENTTAIFSNADTWVQNLEKLQFQVDIPALDIEKSKSSSKLTPFAGNATQNIYEFLDNFESSSFRSGTSKQKADAIYRDLLANHIKIKCLSVSNSYTDLRAWLLRFFGDISFILNQLVVSLEATKKPPKDDLHARLSYFSALSMFFFRVDQLAILSKTEPNTISEYLSSLTVFDKLVRLLPEQDELDLFSRAREKHLDVSQLQGEYALGIYKSLVLARVEDLQRTIEKRSPKNLLVPQPLAKPKAQHINLCDLETLGHVDINTSSGATNTITPSKPTENWFRNGLSFPCNIEGHDHELSSCKEWLQLTPTQRKELGKKQNRRLCWACLKPTSVCRRRCIQ